MLKKRPRTVLMASCHRLVALEWLILLLMLPLLLFPRPASSLLLLFIPLLWTARRITTGAFLPATPLDWPMVVLLFMVLVSLYATFDVAFSFPKVAGILFGIALYYAVSFAVGQALRRVWLGTGLFLAAGWGMGGLSLLTTQWSGQLPFITELVARVQAVGMTIPGVGQEVNPNEVAGVLMWIVPLNAALAFNAMRAFRGQGRMSKPKPLPLYAAALVVSTLFLSGLLILTQSRGGLLGFAASLLFMLIVALRRQWRWMAAILVLLSALAAVITGIVGLETVAASLSNSAGVGNGTTMMNTLEGRLEIWSRAIYGIQDFPLTGMGLNTFRRVVHILYPLFLIGPDVDIAHAHNHLLQTALGLGIPGLIGYLAIWIGAAAMLWQTWGRFEDMWLRCLTLGMAASLLAYFVFGMTDAIALGARPGFLFWGLLGLVAGLHRLALGYSWRRPRG